jgi:hypothetical protein
MVMFGWINLSLTSLMANTGSLLFAKLYFLIVWPHYKLQFYKYKLIKK